jgi:hypothetical protein
MRRLLTFALLGPPLGFVTLLVAGALKSGRLAELSAWPVLIMFMPFAYILGIGPALVAWIADELLSRVLRLNIRLIVSAAVGFAATVLFGYIWSKHSTTRGALESGIFGAIPALACTWIADRLQKRVSSP